MANAVKVAKSKRFTTAAFRAVFPNLHKPDKFGNYSVDVDVLENPEIESTIKAQIKEFLPQAQERLEIKKKPTNDFVREGEISKGERKGEPFRRISFKMKSERKGKDGEPIKQRPRVVDAKKNPLSKPVYGGSKVKVGYFLQYTITPTGCFMSVKLDAVQVIEYVGPGGEVSIDAMFDEEDGYVVPTDEDTNDEDTEDAADSVPTGKDQGDNIKNGSDF